MITPRSLNIKVVLLPIMALGLIVMSGSAPAQPAVDNSPEVLAVVNGDTISSEDLERLIIQTHAGMDRDRKMSFDYRKLFDKLINDRLIVQEAVSLGLSEEEWLVDELAASRLNNAIRFFVKDVFKPDLSVSDKDIEEFFRRYYNRLQVRTVSVAGAKEAMQQLEAVKSGADMDSLAQAGSLDMYRYQGGLHNFKHLADVELAIRDQVASLKPGQLSGVFPYRQVFAFLRLEKTAPADLSELPQFSEKIKSMLITQKQESAWTSFIDSLAGQFPVTLDSAALKNIAADADKLFTPDFVIGDQTVVMSIDAQHGSTAEALRKTISYTAMNAGDQPFDKILIDGLSKAREELILGAAADQAGYLDHAEVVKRYHKSLDSALIEIYIQETIIPRIQFSHAEFEAYYNDHLDDFRQPDQFQLDRIEVTNQDTALQIAARLDGGADFEYLTRQYGAKSATEDEKNQWITLESFPQSIAQAIERLKVGQSTPPYQTVDGWMIFRLRARQAGEIKNLADVDMDLRQVMFQSKFNGLLDETIRILKENSDIQYNQKALETYFEDKS